MMARIALSEGAWARAVAGKSVTADMTRMTRSARAARRSDIGPSRGGKCIQLCIRRRWTSGFDARTAGDFPGRSHRALVAALLGAVDTPAPGVARLAVVVGA